MSPLLELRQLTIALRIGGEQVPVVQGIDLAVEPGAVLGIAGESGSGKTLTGMSVLGLLPPAATVTGEILLDGQNLVGAGPKRLQRVRGQEIAMVFQDPSSTLHPMLTIGHQLGDHVRTHRGVSRREARARAFELLELVRLPDPATALDRYPHQFSGGMRQRIAIAIALACEPRILIADEPTTALDVTVQAGIIALLDELRAQTGMAIVTITHDLGVISSIADEVAVFYAGRVVESGRTADVLGRPRHPYTRGLLDALPREVPAAGERRETGLVPIPGMPPGAGEAPEGCSFSPRCRFRQPQCGALPPLLPVGSERDLRCHVDPWGNDAS